MWHLTKKGKRWINCRHSEFDHALSGRMMQVRCVIEHLCVENFPECTRPLKTIQLANKRLSCQDMIRAQTCVFILTGKLEDSEAEMNGLEQIYLFVWKIFEREKITCVLKTRWSVLTVSWLSQNSFFSIISLTWNKKGIYNKCLKANICYYCL